MLKAKEAANEPVRGNRVGAGAQKNRTCHKPEGACQRHFNVVSSALTMEHMNFRLVLRFFFIFLKTQNPNLKNNGGHS